MGSGKTIVYLGGKQAGCTGLLTVLAVGYQVKLVVSYDVMMSKLASCLGLPIYNSVGRAEVITALNGSDLLLSVHCREIVGQDLLGLPSDGGINVHPCLFGYKGAKPIQKLLEDKGRFASVAVHRMTQTVDEGEVLSEIYVGVEGRKSVEEIYNELYPYYSIAILTALRKLWD